MHRLIMSQLLVGYLFMTVFGSASLAQQTWRADPKLVEKLTKSRANVLYREDKVPPYTLPDPLLTADGAKVTDPETWRTKRRPEILELFRTHMYGRAPLARPPQMTFEPFDHDPAALGHLATRRQIALNLTGQKGGPALDLLIYCPNKPKKPVPAFLILNFGGNHTIHSDPAIKLATSWVRQRGTGVVKNRATEQSRGRAASRFPLELILKRGYALATIYYGDIDPDFHDNYQNGVHALFDKRFGEKRPPDAWASIAAWVWGLSRALDYFETDDAVDHRRVAVLGHSRLGKTALWAGAEDQRFALVISNDSGCGGAALSRRAYGESVARINQSFPHWFCDNFKKYNNNESALPFDQHMLIALIAPRPVYVASADRDLWADPHGEFLSCKNAEPVYRLFKKKGLGRDAMPPLDTPLADGSIGYHVRSGGHDLSTYDWQQYLNFADRHLK